MFVRPDALQTVCQAAEWPLSLLAIKIENLAKSSEIFDLYMQVCMWNQSFDPFQSGDSGPRVFVMYANLSFHTQKEQI